MQLMPKSVLARAAILAGIALLLGSCLFLVGCVRASGGAWYVASAPLPEGWPELTPVGEVRIRQYPQYRAASVTREAADGGTGRMFNALFDHIQRNDIAMTAPVDMGYAASDAEGSPEVRAAKMESMAFLYRTTDLGPTGEDGPVRIEDVATATYASVGVRGSYSQKNFEKGLAKVRDWLDAQVDWKPDGPPRYLGYNGPFTLWFMRYGEVQVPVVAARSDAIGGG